MMETVTMTAYGKTSGIENKGEAGRSGPVSRAEAWLPALSCGVRKPVEDG